MIMMTMKKLKKKKMMMKKMRATAVDTHALTDTMKINNRIL